MSLAGSTETCWPEFSLPRELLALDAEQPDQLRAGAAGKDGRLRVIFKPDGDGKTIIDKQYTQLPFHITRVLRLDERLPEMAYLYVQMPTGGILQGDRLRMDVTVEKGGKAHITTQSVSKVYRMNRNYAAQALEVTVAEDAFFEYYPDALQLHKDARFVQETRLRVHDAATALYGEIVLPGRVASGEAFEYEVYYSSLVAKNQDGRLRFKETILLEPTRRPLSGGGLLGTSSVFGNLYLLTPPTDVAQLSNDVHQLLQGREDISGGSGLLPLHDGIVVRILGPSYRTVKSSMDFVWSDIRESLFGSPAPAIRK